MFRFGAQSPSDEAQSPVDENSSARTTRGERETGTTEQRRLSYYELSRVTRANAVIVSAPVCFGRAIPLPREQSNRLAPSVNNRRRECSVRRSVRRERNKGEKGVRARREERKSNKGSVEEEKEGGIGSVGSTTLFRLLPSVSFRCLSLSLFARVKCVQ